MNGVVGQVTAVLVVEHLMRLAQGRKGLRLKFEANDMGTHLGIRRVVRMVARTVVGNEDFDLVYVLARRSAEPGSFGRRGGHPGQLTYRGERQLATFKRSGELRQTAEGASDPQSVLRRARRMAEHALEVVEGRHHAELAPDLQRLGFAQPARFFSIEGRAPRRDRSKGTVDSSPARLGSESPELRDPAGRRCGIDRCFGLHEHCPAGRGVVFPARDFSAMVWLLRDDSGL